MGAMRQCLGLLAAGVVASITLAAVGAGAQSTPDRPSEVRYRGRVLDTSGGTLPGVDVTCTVRDGTAYRTRSDDKGEYAIPSTTGACERMVFELAYFVSERFTAPSAGVLDVSMSVVDIADREWIAGAGRGVVVNHDGSPAVDASVWLWRIGGAAPASWRTDRDGTFEIPLTDYTGHFVLCARGVGEHRQMACLPVTTEPFPGGTTRLQLSPPAQ
jgi:hypothetical protein